jgi:hypothetical protein
MTTPVDTVDAVLLDANLPTYTETMQALHKLALEVGLAPRVDTHVIYKTWALLDRYSAIKQRLTPWY